MLKLIDLLEGGPLSQFQLSGGLKKLFLKNFLDSAPITIIPSVLTSFPVPCNGKSHQHDAVATVLHCKVKCWVLVSSKQKTFLQMFGES